MLQLLKTQAKSILVCNLLIKVKGLAIELVTTSTPADSRLTDL